MQGRQCVPAAANKSVFLGLIKSRVFRATMEEQQQRLLHEFMEIVPNEPLDRARQFMRATNWQLSEAVQLYFAGGSDSIPIEDEIAAPQPAAAREPIPLASASNLLEEYVRPPLPVKREALYEFAVQHRAQRMGHTPGSVDAFRNFEDEASERAGVASFDTSIGSSGAAKASLAALYRPPFTLMFQGSFEQAKAEAIKQSKWLLVNLQSNKEFSSYTLNRDTWAHEAVKDTVGTTFVFWQVYDDTEEGIKVCTYYHLSTMPTILVLDPLTGQKMRAWDGMVGAERLLEDLVPYMDRGPLDGQPCPPKRQRDVAQQVTTVGTPKGALKVPYGSKRKNSEEEEEEEEREEREEDDDDELQRALAASLENGPVVDDQVTRVRYPELPEEPKADDVGSCRVAVRFPNGNRGQRRFLRSDPIAYLWSYCATQIKEAADGRKFRLTQTIPGVVCSLNYNTDESVGDAGVANSVLGMAWD